MARVLLGAPCRSLRPEPSFLRITSQVARPYHRSPEPITDQAMQAYLLLCHLRGCDINSAPDRMGIVIRPPEPCWLVQTARHSTVQAEVYRSPAQVVPGLRYLRLNGS
jgi:hypothetical protein